MKENCKFIEIGESAPNSIDKYKGFVVLNTFNEGVLSKISSNKNITVIISVDDLISKDGIYKSKELHSIRRMVKFLIKYSIRFVFTAKDRTKEELSLIGTLFNLNYQQSKEIVNKI